ncbi:MAG: 2-oxoglutarate oxidoreductase [Parasporobacterium sp.]|nr:2-oxoglutarate oxidoreductase [Parasporobacterium sp.]
MAVAKKRPTLTKDHGFCAGCGHGLFIRLLHEVLDETGYAGNFICVDGVGCSSNYFMATTKGSAIESHHGKAPTIARGVKLARPETLVFTYQGDGDAYVIGLSETLNAAHFGAPITTFVINNNNYGMTGGQMSWTTLPGQKTTTSPGGRNPEQTGLPIDPLQMAARFDAVAYAARGALNSPRNINMAKKYIRKAIELQIRDGKYAIVELLSPCPTDWNMAPVKAIEWIDQEVTKYYPLGEFKGTEE